MSRPPIPEEDKLKQRFPLRCNDETFESWMQAMDDMQYKYESEFCINMINRGIQSEKEISFLKDHIKKLEDENKHLKEIQKIVGGVILWDIMEYLFPESPSEQPPIWSIANLHEVLPRYPEEQINEVLASHQDIFEYIKDKGWRLINELEYLN